MKKIISLLFFSTLLSAQNVTISGSCFGSKPIILKKEDASCSSYLGDTTFNGRSAYCTDTPQNIAIGYLLQNDPNNGGIGDNPAGWYVIKGSSARITHFLATSSSSPVGSYTAGYQNTLEGCTGNATVALESSLSVDEGVSKDVFSIYQSDKSLIFNSSQNLKIEMYDLNGKLIKIFFMNRGLTNIDVSNFPKGIYIFAGILKDKKFSKKIIIR